MLKKIASVIIATGFAATAFAQSGPAAAPATPAVKAAPALPAVPAVGGEKAVPAVPATPAVKATPAEPAKADTAKVLDSAKATAKHAQKKVKASAGKAVGKHDAAMDMKGGAAAPAMK